MSAPRWLSEHRAKFAELAELADRVFAAKPLHRQLIRADVWADTVEATGINPGMVLWPNPAADLLDRWQR